MATLKKKDVNDLNYFLERKGLLRFINAYLQENNLAFEAVAVKLQPVVQMEAFGPPPGPARVCKEVCKPSGICEEVCVPPK